MGPLDDARFRLHESHGVLEEATALARSGVVSLLVDAPMVRPGIQPKGDVESYQKAFRQDVIDLRRGIDLLLARKDVDARRFAYIGHSFHAATGGVLAGIDPRVSAFVLMAGGMDSARVLVSRSSYAEDMRKKMGEAELNKFVATSRWMNPATYLGQRKHGPLLLQFGTHDLFMTKEDCDEYASVVSAPKEVKFYDSGHELNAAARHDRIQWLQNSLSLRTVDWKAIGDASAIR
jgi:pimeloyl-ACP methyl ester carboxylesterase